MKTHKLKIWPEYYRAVVKGKKTFEIRRNDRNFKVNDLLILEEWHPKKEAYTGRWMEARIKYVGTELPGVLDGFVALGIEVLTVRSK